jgi:ribosomal protein S18 acetylase RimI-like enzyme
VTTARPASPAEAEAVARLFNAINSLDGGAPAVPMTAEILRRDLLGPAPRAVLLVAEHAGTVAGFVTGSLIYDAERAADAMMLLDLYVAPEARRLGLGRTLMAGLAEEALRRDAACLWWGVDEGDDAALAFYRAIGAASEGPFTGMILAGGELRRLATEGVRA